MRQLSYIIERNVMLFRKNRKNVCLCFAAIFIVFGLYAIFLRDFMIQSVQSSGIPEHLMNEFTDSLMLSGLLVVVNTTTCFGIMQLSIHDLEIGIRKDYLIAPIKKTHLLYGYWCTSVVVSFIYTVFAYIAIVVYCNIRYDMVMNPIYILQIVILILFSSIINSEILLCMVAFIKDTTSFSTFGNLYGMLSGFLAGTYLPYQMYPERLKSILIYYAPTHLTSFMRQIFLLHTSNKEEEMNDLYNYLYQIYGVRLVYHQEICTHHQQFALIGFASVSMFLFLQFWYREKRSN